ncbi:MAG TPA: hypothetical protein VEJ84_10040 [Acidimicrobiales bacterium]|nr:hypothetical protein [Acidimicrobiales bacterium]
MISPPAPCVTSKQRSAPPSHTAVGEAKKLPQPLFSRARSLAPEVAAVLASPVVFFYAFRLRAMSSAGGVPDPGLHTSYIWDPRDAFARYASKIFSPGLQQYFGPPAAYLREGARTGFLVPARLAYLGFGALPGFFVFRYVLALVAVVPAYVLLKRLYGVGAGVLAIVVIMSAPVVVTAWGTDFPDSAEVSYLIGGFACLVMPAASRRAQVCWTAAAGTLLTLSVWALASSALLIAASLVVWVLVRAVRARRWLFQDIVVLATVFIIVTALLAPVWWGLSGQADYITATFRSLEFLMTRAQEELWHSSSWRWAGYDNYLLVLPAVALAWVVVFCRSRRLVHPAVLTLGGAAIAQLLVAAYAQFLNHVEILENHYFSSGLWAISTLVLVVVVAELTSRFSRERLAQFVPAALAAAVALGSEAAPPVPAFRWAPFGLCLVVVVVVVALYGRVRSSWASGALADAGSAVCSVVVMAALLVLTVAPSPPLALTRGIVADPSTGYQGALGGSASAYVAYYQLAADVRGFVPKATYPGEQLVACWSIETPMTLEILSIFHAGPNILPGLCPGRIGRQAVQEIMSRRAAQLLVVDIARFDIGTLMSRLRSLNPQLVRHAVFWSNGHAAGAWLIQFPRYLGPKAH